MYEVWCPNSNFVKDVESARAWSASHELEGRTLSLYEASELATRDWLPLTPTPLRRSEVSGSRQMVLQSSRTFTEAFERILGIMAGSVTLADEATLRFGFG
jgi:hypothetical protein